MGTVSPRTSDGTEQLQVKFYASLTQCRDSSKQKSKSKQVKHCRIDIQANNSVSFAKLIF